nr:MAG TPA: hypothetical protein [Caudoviricetes sp.]
MRERVGAFHASACGQVHRLAVLCLAWQLT